MKRPRVQIAAELDALLPAILDKAFKGELGSRAAANPAGIP
jgi:hypothetical protein